MLQDDFYNDFDKILFAYNYYTKLDFHTSYCIHATGAKETRNHQRNSVLRMTWTQELFLSS